MDKQIKCQKLEVENFYPGNHPLIVLGFVKKFTNSYIVFRTGAGKEYKIDRTKPHTLCDTDIPYREGVRSKKVRDL